MADLCDPPINREVDDPPMMHDEEFTNLLLRYGESFCLIKIDAQGYVTRIHSGINSHLRLESENIVGQHFSFFFLSTDISAEVPNKLLCTAREQGHAEYDGWMMHKNGNTFRGNLSIYPLSNDKEQSEFGMLIQDISRYEQVDVSLQESLERYALIVHGANDGIWDWNLKENRISYSPRWKSILGYQVSEISESPNEWFDRIHIDDRENVKKKIDSHLNGDNPHFECEQRLLHRDGKYRWVLARGLAAWDENKKARRMAGSITDITERKEKEERLKHDTMHDPLTLLPNRVYFFEQTGRVIERVKRNPTCLAAIFVIDIDRFSLINDSYGQEIGNQLLLSMAQRLSNCFRSADTVARFSEMIARFGGDEFAILLEDIKNEDDILKIAKRILEDLSQPYNLIEGEIFASSSIGIAIIKPGYESPQSLIHDADIAMYQAKSNGRGNYQLYNPGLTVQNLSMTQLETDLRHALERKELRVVYQPIISLSSGDIIKVEALMRWQHPIKGELPPSEFIHLAEETGLIIPMGEWILNHACSQTKRWHEAGYAGLHVAVNIAARQLQGGNFPETVRKVLKATGLPAQNLQLEITERAAMQNIDETIETLQELNNMGIEISMDDFGTSYSSLGYLKRFPVSSLKIDRSFIKDIHRDTGDAAITSAIIAMGHVLNIYVVAEGVEEAGQLDFLMSQYCDEVQGFLISKPISQEKITAILKDGRNMLQEHLQTA